MVVPRSAAVGLEYFRQLRPSELIAFALVTLFTHKSFLLPANFREQKKHTKFIGRLQRVFRTWSDVVSEGGPS